jgi:Fe-S cluster assembly iron-binding protein IscA
MLGLTRESVRAIRELTESDESADGVRLYAASRRFARASTPSIQIEVAESAGVEDTVLELDGARLFLDSETLRVLDDKVLDADLTGAEPRFAILQLAEGARV